MPAPHNPVDLYDSAYGNYAADVYRQVRLATYGEDLGQTSWVTNEESGAIPHILQLTPASRVLEIGCGSGGYALQVAAMTIEDGVAVERLIAHTCNMIVARIAIAETVGHQEVNKI